MKASAAFRVAVLPLLALACAGCRTFSPEQRATHVEKSSVTTTTGVVYEELALGRGEPAVAGDEVLIDYVVSLENGKPVDSTLDRGVPVTVKLGEAFVRGLDDGLAGIRAGGRRRITVPPELAYGDEGVPDLVPPGSTLVFEVHAVEVHRAH